MLAGFPDNHIPGVHPVLNLWSRVDRKFSDPLGVGYYEVLGEVKSGCRDCSVCVGSCKCSLPQRMNIAGNDRTNGAKANDFVDERPDVASAYAGKNR